MAHPYSPASWNSAEHYTWGSASFPEKAAEELRLDTHLQRVPQGGIVADIGAGIGLSLEAAIHVRRPDIRTVAIDPGFSLDMNPLLFRDNLEITVDRFSSPRRAILQNSPDWYTRCLAGYAEQLPIRSDSVDMVVSYATIPEYTHADLSLDESLRILKVGGLAVFGPMEEITHDRWEALISAANARGQLTSYDSWNQEFEVMSGDMIDAWYSSFHK